MDPLSIAAGAVIGEATKQATKFLAAAIGHAGEDIGTVLGIKYRERVQRAESVLAAAALITLNLKFEPAKIPDKILIPALEAASLEEDDDLQQRWASLIAMASDPTKRVEITPLFISVLKELTAREVKFLDAIYEETVKRMPSPLAIPTAGITILYSEEDLARFLVAAGLARTDYIGDLTDDEKKGRMPELFGDLQELTFMISVLKRQQIIEEVADGGTADLTKVTGRFAGRMGQKSAPLHLEQKYKITYFGMKFVSACRPPEPSSAS